MGQFQDKWGSNSGDIADQKTKCYINLFLANEIGEDTTFDTKKIYFSILVKFTYMMACLNLSEQIYIFQFLPVLDFKISHEFPFTNCDKIIVFTSNSKTLKKASQTLPFGLKYIHLLLLFIFNIICPLRQSVTFLWKFYPYLAQLSMSHKNYPYGIVSISLTIHILNAFLHAKISNSMDIIDQKTSGQKICLSRILHRKAVYSFISGICSISKLTSSKN